MKTGIASFAAILLFTVFGLSVSTTSYGQARPSSKGSVIAIDPLDLALQGPVNIQYEMRTSPVNSWAFRAYLWPARSSYTAFGVGAAYRFFIADSRALTGLSVAPAADVFFFNSSDLGTSFTAFEIGGDLAYKWIFDQFAVEPLFGLRIGFGGAEGVSYATGFLPRLGLYLGYAW